MLAQTLKPGEEGAPQAPGIRGLVEAAYRVLAAAAEKALWSIGFSGGKDSSVVLDLALRFLLDGCPGAPRCPRRVAVVYADTLLDPPGLRLYARGVVEAVNRLAEETGAPVAAAAAEPAPGEDIVAMVIVKGYPAPSPRFRWCSDRWKIRPSRAALEKILGRPGPGELAVITGVRAEEAAHRAARSPEPGAAWIIHRDDLGGSAYAPINNWTTRDVWAYIAAAREPAWRSPGWGELRRAYLGRPVLRMGCWACTLVARDKAWETLAREAAVDPGLYTGLDAWRRLWLHMSRARPDIWRQPKARTATKKGRTWRYRYGKLRPEARLILAKLLQAIAEAHGDNPVTKPLRERLRLYQAEIARLEEHAPAAEKLLQYDPAAAAIIKQTPTR